MQLTSRRAFIGGAAATALAVAVSPSSAGAQSNQSVLTPEQKAKSPVRPGGELASNWVRTLYAVVMAEGLTPPAAARFYHYTSLAMYETAVPMMPDHRSIAKRMHGLERAPKPTKRGKTDLSIAVSEAVAAVALGLLPNAAETSKQLIQDQLSSNSLSPDFSTTNRSGSTDATRSAQYGREVGEHLMKWIQVDGYSEASSLSYTPPTGPGLWRSTPPNFGTAIEPHWAMVRPAVLRTADEVEPAPPVPFSAEPGSEFHDQAMVTYKQSFANTDEQIAIARFWTDNPRLSGLPAGHWFLLLADVSQFQLKLNLDDTLEGFVRLGVALHDAFTNCWTWKYRINLIRPVSYVRDHIDPAWTTLVNTPQFPEYTSGHSVASGAAEVVLTSLFGKFAFVDSTGEPRGLGSRGFNSFTHAAEEAASSRLYGGIHFPMGIDNGVEQGREVGRLVDKRLKTRNKSK